jgi:succinyl-CoA synthetase alpha subunit
VAILLNEHTEVVVQGITGREARLRARVMRDYGTRVVAGVTPGRGGQQLGDIPIYDTVEEARAFHPALSASAIFAPARFARSATLEALSAGIRLITLHAERVPHQDMLEIVAHARRCGARVIGPNALGVISPGRALLGMFAGTAEVAREWFMPGPVGVISRSGGSTATLAYYLTKAGIGQSTVVSVGGDAHIGTTWADLLPMFEQDEQTRAVAAFGEIGTEIEAEAADVIRRGGFTKPLVFYIAGRYARPGVRFGHAGALIGSARGTFESKVQALREAGAFFVDHLPDLPGVVAQVLAGRLQAQAHTPLAVGREDDGNAD